MTCSTSTAERTWSAQVQQHNLADKIQNDILVCINNQMSKYKPVLGSVHWNWKSVNVLNDTLSASMSYYTGFCAMMLRFGLSDRWNEAAIQQLPVSRFHLDRHLIHPTQQCNQMQEQKDDGKTSRFLANSAREHNINCLSLSLKRDLINTKSSRSFPKHFFGSGSFMKSSKKSFSQVRGGRIREAEALSFEQEGPSPNKETFKNWAKSVIDNPDIVDYKVTSLRTKHP